MTTNEDATTSKSKDAADPTTRITRNVNVGVLGHVDSGKTSLVKALSQTLSTAALDKSVQSRQRGMTLDLGFSCFYLSENGPSNVVSETAAGSSDNDKSSSSLLQVTLVDCPGHASLIRTIIGGAQIIDTVLLVVDAVKGWQAQTTECLVLAELTNSPGLVVALNKCDMLEASRRDELFQQAADCVRYRLQGTRFAKTASIVGVAACVGGEKVAAVTGDGAATTAATTTDAPNETYNMDELISTLRSHLVPLPRRETATSFIPATLATRQHPPEKGTDDDESKLFYFAIDHCFPIRGRGTVLTGTVLRGSVSVNSMIEFPSLGRLQRKIKSMQMFHQPVTTLRTGDRAGICVAQLDADQMERGMAAAPGAVPVLTTALAVVRKVPYFVGARLSSGSKFHVSVGHTTVMATVTFFGARELHGDSRLQQSGNDDNAGFGDLPFLEFDFEQDFVQQDEHFESLPAVDGSPDDAASSVTTASSQPLLHWALLEFATPVYCPLGSLVIGSRLDSMEKTATAASAGGAKSLASTDGTSASSCRLAFAGRLLESIDPAHLDRIRLYTPKERRGVIRRLGDPHKRLDDDQVVRYEVFGSDLFKKETNMKLFLGMKMETERGDVGEIKSSFGTAGQFRVFFPQGTQAREGDALLLRFKRYARDPQKAMHQEDIVLPAARPGKRMEVEKKKKGLPKGVKRVGQVDKVKGDVLESNGKHNTAILSGFFAPEVNIKEYAGVKVRIPSTNEEGSIVGPFGKAGKCKGSFEEGVSAESGAKAELLL